MASVQPLQSTLANSEPETPLQPIELPYKPKWGSCGTKGMEPGFCTYGVAKWICIPDGLSHAKYWDDYARARGIKVSSVPAVGTVAQTDAGYWGHVAVVLKIEGDRVYTRGMNEGGLWVIKERWSPVSDWKFIYF